MTMPNPDDCHPRTIPPHLWVQVPGDVPLEVMHQSPEVQDILVLPSGEVLLGGFHWFVRVKK